MVNDHEYVNFSQDHELDYRLRVNGKAQSKENRDTLKVMGDELKNQLNKTMLTHKEFDAYVKKNLHRLED